MSMLQVVGPTLRFGAEYFVTYRNHLGAGTQRRRLAFIGSRDGEPLTMAKYYPGDGPPVRMLDWEDKDARMGPSIRLAFRASDLITALPIDGEGLGAGDYGPEWTLSESGGV